MDSTYRRYMNLGGYSYDQFKTFVNLYGNSNYVFWSNVAGAKFLMNICPHNDITIWSKGSSLSLDADTIAADFPTSVQLTSSTINSHLYPLSQFSTDTYSEWKLIVNTMNFGGPILYTASGSDVTSTAAYGADGSWDIHCSDTLTTSAFLTDFPNAILVDNIAQNS